MGQLELENGESGLSVRTKLNNMFANLFTAILQGSNLKDFIYKDSSFTIGIENIENITVLKAETEDVVITIPSNMELAGKQAIIKFDKMTKNINFISEAEVLFDESNEFTEKQSITVAFGIENEKLKAIFI